MICEVLHIGTWGAYFRKIELYIDTQRDIQDYIWCVIGSDQPSNWEVNSVISDSVNSIHFTKCANFDQGRFFFWFILKYGYTAFVPLNTQIFLGASSCIRLAKINHQKGFEATWLRCHVCIPWRIPEPICRSGTEACKGFVQGSVSTGFASWSISSHLFTSSLCTAGL